jgi:hypothetical protein
MNIRKIKLLMVLITLCSLLAWTPNVAQAVVKHHRQRYRHGYVVKRRSKRKQAAIIGGSALAGAGVGALAGGKKGATIGAAAGGAGGTAYDLKTRNKKVYR